MRMWLLSAWTAALLFGADREVDPTFLRRRVPEVAEKAADVTTKGCHYKPVFAGGGIVKGVARFGEMTVDPGGSSELVSYPREEQVYVVLEGVAAVHYGSEKVAVRRHDFLYLPPGVRHGVSNTSDKPFRLIVMGFKIPASMPIVAPTKPLVANIDDVKKQVVGGHPPSTLYQLLVGDTRSTRDRIAAGHVLTSLFIMSIEPGGTNQPHHHEREEEIYLVLDGEGEMVAGGGITGVEGRHPARAGDAYFFRLNCTVGYYAKTASRILAVRSLFPFPER